MEGFRWIDWNLEHATKHGVTIAEIESVVRSADPRHEGDGKFKVIGRGQGGRWIQVIYVYDPDGTVFVIHSRPLTDREKKRARRQ
jgi:uncharacterized DUF497 family protein